MTNEPEDIGDYELEERQALRRVAGLSTELEDVTEVEYRQLRLERVVLVGVWTSGTVFDAENSLQELKLLAETAGSEILEGLIQRRDRPDAATYIGSGKAIELRDVVASTGADTVICDGELTPGQLRQLEEIVKVKVIDRTALILDIFAQHAKSREGKAQVELAQLSYLLPRLRGWGGNLSRQVGGRAAGGVGIGGRGPGETKIELDRRRIRERMSKLRRQIKEMSTARDTMRNRRQRREVPAVAIAGYTNAGKSLAPEPADRRGSAGGGRPVRHAGSDGTPLRAPRRPPVHPGRHGGFRAPPAHQLVEAFRSTLEEVGDADLILHVVDGSHPDPESQLAAVREVFAEIEGARDIPEIVVINKADAASPEVIDRLTLRERHSIVVSARTGQGITELMDLIEQELPHLDHEIHMLVPYDRGDLVARAHKEGEVLSVDHTGGGTVLHARVPSALLHELDRVAKPVETV